MDWLRAQICSDKFIHVNTIFCYIKTITHFVFNYIIAYLVISAETIGICKRCVMLSFWTILLLTL